MLPAVELYVYVAVGLTEPVKILAIGNDRFVWLKILNTSARN
jgi:hypothetical protein